MAGIPVVATVRILDANALHNERARADAALEAQLQQAGQTLQGLSDNAAGRAEDISRSPVLQRAFLTKNRTVIAELARKNPDLVFYLDSERVAGRSAHPALTRSVSLTLNGVTVGRVVAAVPLGPRLAKRLLKGVAHAPHDQLLVVHEGRALGSGARVHPTGRTIEVGNERYRGVTAPIPNAPGTHLVALRPEHAISAAVAPVQAAHPLRGARLVRAARPRRPPLRRPDPAPARRLPPRRLAGRDRLAHRAGEPPHASTRSSRSSGGAPTASATRSRSSCSTSTTSST